MTCPRLVHSQPASQPGRQRRPPLRTGAQGARGAVGPPVAPVAHALHGGLHAARTPGQAARGARGTLPTIAGPRRCLCATRASHAPFGPNYDSRPPRHAPFGAPAQLTALHLKTSVWAGFDWRGQRFTHLEYPKLEEIVIEDGAGPSGNSAAVEMTIGFLHALRTKFPLCSIKLTKTGLFRGIRGAEPARASAGRRLDSCFRRLRGWHIRLGVRAPRRAGREDRSRARPSYTHVHVRLVLAYIEMCRELWWTRHV